MVANIWSEFLKIAKDEVGSRIVETWFKAVSLYRWDQFDQTVYLQAPNTFVRDWIKSNYLPLIELHLKRLFHVEHIKILFVYEQEPEKSIEPEISKKTSELVTVQEQKIVSADTIFQKKRVNGYRNYVFESFVVGPNNSLAYAAAQAVAQKPGAVYNPLFIYGGSGLGKTHLLHAIGHEIKLKNKKAAILYQTADRFVNEFINAIRFDKIHQFQQKYKNVDVLLIDDIQFISNKEQTQEAFFHIFNALYDSEKQIVFSSDAFPQDIMGIAERLKYRLSWGLVVDMHVPTLETKVAIIKKAEMNEQEISDEVAHFIADHSITNIRELEGSLIRVLAFATLTKQQITLELAQKVLIRKKETIKQPVSMEKIAQCIGKFYPYDLAKLRSKSRSKDLALARQITMFLMKKITEKPLRDIGHFLGGRDHSTVMHAFTKINQQIKHNPDFKSHIRQIEQEILNYVR